MIIYSLPGVHVRDIANSPVQHQCMICQTYGGPAVAATSDSLPKSDKGQVNALKVIILRWWSIQKPEGKHVDGHTGPSKDGGRDTGSPHRRNPSLKGNDDVGIRPTPNGGRVAVAVIE